MPAQQANRHFIQMLEKDLIRLQIFRKDDLRSWAGRHDTSHNTRSAPLLPAYDVR